MGLFNKKKFCLAIILIFLLSSTGFLMPFSFVYGEYRAYSYMVSYPLLKKPKEISTLYTVSSSLAPQYFVAYNGGPEVISVQLFSTWICKGETSFHDKVCDPPEELKPEKLKSEELKLDQP